jgi:hypothetical protein
MNNQGRWNAKETAALAQMRAQLHQARAFELVPSYQDLVGDRRLLRFLRGKGGDVNAAVTQYHSFLRWYVDQDILSIRHKILYEGCNSPIMFPKGKEFLALAPHLVCALTHKDCAGRPIVFESFDFDPNEFVKKLSVEDYVLFLKYCLEYRSLVLEQMSEEAEAANLRQGTNTGNANYGVVLTLCIIRDLNGVGWSHITSSITKSIITAGLDIAVPNYPDTLGKSHMINVPMIFHGLWLFIRNLLDATIIEKINICSSYGYLQTLEKDIPIQSVPAVIGGQMPAEVMNHREAFAFDITEERGLFVLVDPLEPQMVLSALTPAATVTAPVEESELADLQVSVVETADCEAASTDSANTTKPSSPDSSELISCEIAHDESEPSRESLSVPECETALEHVSSADDLLEPNQESISHAGLLVPEKNLPQEVLSESSEPIPMPFQVSLLLPDDLLDVSSDLVLDDLPATLPELLDALPASFKGPLVFPDLQYHEESPVKSPSEASCDTSLASTPQAGIVERGGPEPKIPNKIRLQKHCQRTADGDYIFQLRAASTDSDSSSDNDNNADCGGINDEISSSSPNAKRPASILRTSMSTERLKLRVKKQLIFYDGGQYSSQGERSPVTTHKAIVLPTSSSPKSENECSDNHTEKSADAFSERKNKRRSPRLLFFGVNILQLLPSQVLYFILAVILFDHFVVSKHRDAGSLLHANSSTSMLLRAGAIVVLGCLLVLHAKHQHFNKGKTEPGVGIVG